MKQKMARSRMMILEDNAFPPAKVVGRKVWRLQRSGFSPREQLTLSYFTLNIRHPEDSHHPQERGWRQHPGKEMVTYGRKLEIGLCPGVYTLPEVRDMGVRRDGQS